MVPVVTVELTSLRRQADAISNVLAERRESLRHCLLAAAVRSEDAETLLAEAIDSVKVDAWLGSNPGRLLVHALDAICESYAEARAVPYRLLLQVFKRHWATIDSRMMEAGLAPSACEAVLRTLVRTTPGSEWGEAERPDGVFLAKVDAICSAHARATGRVYRPRNECPLPPSPARRDGSRDQRPRRRRAG